MKDLELHARLDEGALDEGLIPALQGLAWRPVERRVAYLGLLEACLGHESGALRAAAIACLSGCLGPRAVRAMVTGLDDPSESVRHAAIDALADTARTHSSRYAHALFHDDAAIRRRALERCPPEAHELAARLFADPACQDRLESIDLPNDVGFVLGLVERGHLRVAEGRAWLLGRDPNALMRFLLAHLGPGTVHRILALFDDGPADERERIHRRLAGLAGRNESLGELLAGAMRAEAIRDPEGPALELALRLDLAVLLEEAIGGDHRRAALAALGATRPLFPKDPSDRRELAETLFDRLLRPAGALHWAGAAALAALVDGGQLAFLLGQLHPEAGGDGSSRRARMRLLVDQATADPEPFHRLMRADKAALRRFGAATKELAGPADPRAPLASVLLASCAHRAELVDDLRAIWSPTDLVHAIHALETRFERVLASDVMKRAYAVGLRRHLDAGVSWSAILGGLDPEGPLGGRLLESLATLGVEPLVEALRALAVDELVRWLPLIERLPSGRDHAVATALAAHADPRVASWAKERELFATHSPPRELPSLHELTDEEVAAIAAGGPVPVDRPLRRLCEALEERVLFPTPRICGALLACGDPFDDVAAALQRWSDGGELFGPHFDGRVVDEWFELAGSSLLLHAWLYRWEAHAEQAARRVLELGPAFLERVARWPCAELSDRVFRAIGRELRVARYRGPDARLEPWATAPWIDGFIAQLDTPHGVGAARALTAIYERGLATELLAARREAVAARLAAFTDAVREDLRGWIASRGLPSRTRASRIVAGRRERLAEVRRSRDLDRLAEWLSDWAVGEDAAIRLVELGEEGERRLLAVIDEGGERSVVAARATLLFEHVRPSELRARLAKGSLPPEARFLIATALDDAEAAVTIACEPLAGESWLRVEDAERLERQLGERFMHLAAPSPHPAAYELAVRRALARDAFEALRAFLFADDQRDGRLRFRSALKLHVAGDRCGAPILWEHALLGDGYVHDLDAKTFAPIGAGVLLLGVGRLEQRFFDRVDRSTPTPVAAELWSAALRDGTTRHTRTRAASALAHIARRRDRAIRELAEVFAWGTKRGLELTGRLMRFHLVSDPRHFGHTDLRTHDIHVTARPILKGEPEGQRVVEGLVLHELGHQLYHRGREHLAVWERAGRKRIQPLMNLVLDEHLERNLRALDAELGDRLKTLCAYAFQHGGRSMVVELVGALGVDAAPALIATELAVAEEPDSVRVGSGPLLGALERQGHSFARFFRALRMGLGDRHDDPKVRAGLALFDRRFRHAGPEELWTVALELQRIFGEEIGLAAHIGGHETEAAGELEGVTEGAGIHEGEVQREVERILEPPKKSQRGSTGGGAGRLAINVGADAGFEPITEVARLPQDREAHRAVMREVALPSRRLRRAFEELGVRAVPQRRRLSGHRLDRTQLKALITRRDPRILVARERMLARDLFLGMAIDCSGSMVGESMDKAHRFGVLLAEATRGLDGVDTRIFGFTDSQIFDCGDAESCAVTSLESGGGNNDAAGLAHVAAHARRSRRTSKLLVMISDGLPTECSVDAVRGLSRKLAREGLMNAQIAVRPLEEQCFDHYIEVLDEDYAAAAARFGKVLMKLASRALS